MAAVLFRLTEGNDESVALTITPLFMADDLTGVTVVELILKDSDCDADADGLVLSSTDPADLLIVTHTATLITATAFIPHTAIAEPYQRWARVDVLNAAGQRRTAMSGVVPVDQA